MTNLLPLLIAIATTSQAATITVGAVCGGNVIYQLQGPLDASCSSRLDVPTGPGTVRTFFATAHGSVRLDILGVDLSTMAQADTGNSSSASASYHAVLDIFVAGGSGSGFLLPLMFGATTFGFASGGATLTGTGIVPSSAPCSGMSGCAAFTFGQSNQYTLDLYSQAFGSAFGSSSSAHFSGDFRFWDADGNLLSGVQVIISDTPEPSSAWLLAIGGVAALLLRLRQNWVVPEGNSSTYKS